MVEEYRWKIVMRQYSEWVFLQTLTICGTKSIFKRSKAGLNSEYPLSYTCYLTKAKDLSITISSLAAR